jgi:Cu(I)/Ag(I) efflux system membrane fusion protein
VPRLLLSARLLAYALVAVLGAPACSHGPTSSAPAASPAAHSTILYYRNPMDPRATSPVPAKDSMGMDYVPVYARATVGAGDDNAIRVSADALRTLGVRTEPVLRGKLPAEVRALGVTRYDERAMREVRVRAEGWIERFPALGVGDPVRRGQLLFEMYSLRLEAAEQEYLSSLQYGDAARLELSATRLRDLGVDDTVIHGLKERHVIPHLIPFRASVAGALTEAAVHAGSYVSPDMVLFRIAPIDPLIVLFEVPQSSARLVAAGDPVAMSIDGSAPGALTGRVDLVYPEVTADTRTVRFRVVLANPRGALRANMYVSGVIRTASGGEVLNVSREALIRGAASDRVIVALGDGRFVARQVTLGAESADRVAVLAGLTEGERVVSSAVFLLDSETNLHSGLARLQGAADDQSRSQSRARGPGQ